MQRHVWALTMGLQAASPAVTQELARHVKRAQWVRQDGLRCREALKGVAEAGKKLSHYREKVPRLLQERYAAERQGRALSTQQVEKLARNQQKLAEAELEHEKMEAFQRSLPGKMDKWMSELTASLGSFAQIIACGFFISTGAFVCQALHA